MEENQVKPAEATRNADMARSLATQKRLSAIVIAIGALMVFLMIVFEDEPGGIPVGVLTSGILWHFITRRRIRRARSLPGADARAGNEN